MLRYIGKRFASWLAMIIVATNLTYFLASGFLDPRNNYLQLRPPRTPEDIAITLQRYNLDPGTPILERWWTWFSGILFRWDWGASPVGASVNTEVGFRVGVSGQLVFLSLILSVAIGIALGVYTASRQYKFADRFNQLLSTITLNIPAVVAGLIVVLIGIAINQGIGTTLLYVAGAQSPTVSGFWPTVLDRIQHLILPTISLTLISYAQYHLLQRALLLDNINSDFVRTARAKGLTKQQAIRKHGLRTSLIPVATSVAFAIPAIFTGAVITETIFNWQGMGRYLVETIGQNDIHGAVAVAAFTAFVTALGAILSDIAVVFLDPRVRVS